MNINQPINLFSFETLYLFGLLFLYSKLFPQRSHFSILRNIKRHLVVSLLLLICLRITFRMVESRKAFKGICPVPNDQIAPIEHPDLSKDHSDKRYRRGPALLSNQASFLIGQRPSLRPWSLRPIMRDNVGSRNQCGTPSQ